MASPNAYPSAFAASGPDVVSLAGNYLVSTVYWVDSVNGNDANAGTEPELPKATLASVTALAADALILVAPNHVETMGAQTLNQANNTIIGLGVGSAMPRITSNVAGAMWTLTGNGNRFFNLYFPASIGATTARIAITSGTNATIDGCYFECGANDTTNCITIAAAGARIEHSSFVATASRPARAINITAAVADVTLHDVLVDGGSYGWSNHAIDNTSAAATRLFAYDVRLANRSDFFMSVTASTYQLLGVRPIDGSGSRIVITA